MQSDSMMVWIDMEMTGLCPQSCAIVEIAVILTDRNLEPVDHPLELVIWQPPSVLERMEPFVRNMHEKSGLLDRIKRSQISVAGAERQALELVSRYCKAGTARLCGNSIDQDRRFMREYMPALEGYMHYRNVDVSSLKELAKWWNNLKYVKPEEGQHTALHDIQQSIAELRYYRKHFLQPPE